MEVLSSFSPSSAPFMASHPFSPSFFPSYSSSEHQQQQQPTQQRYFGPSTPPSSSTTLQQPQQPLPSSYLSTLPTPPSSSFSPSFIAPSIQREQPQPQLEEFPKKRRHDESEESSSLFQQKRSHVDEEVFPTVRRKRKDFQADIEATQSHKRYQTDLEAQLKEMNRYRPKLKALTSKPRVLSLEGPSDVPKGSLTLYNQPQANYLVVEDPELLRFWMLQNPEEVRKLTKNLKSLPIVVFRKPEPLPAISSDEDDSEGPRIEEVKETDTDLAMSEPNRLEELEIEPTNEMELE